MITTIYNDQANNFSLILLWQTDISDSEKISHKSGRNQLNLLVSLPSIRND